MSFKVLNEKLNNFSHVQAKIELLWGTNAGRNYLKSLLIADRSDRQGFPMYVIVVITNLITLHDSLFPEYVPKIDIWEDIV